MTDLFHDKAQDWDERPLPAQISAGVGPLLLEKVSLTKSTRVLDFGAGTGLISSYVAPSVAKIFAVDISASMLEKLAAKPELAGVVEPVCQDILETPLHEPVDLIMSAMALHHVENTDRLFEVFAEHLQAGGQLALADLDSEDGTFHPPDIEGVFHHGFDRGELQALLETRGFEAVEFNTAVTVTRDEKPYPIFLVTATKS